MGRCVRRSPNAPTTCRSSTATTSSGESVTVSMSRSFALIVPAEGTRSPVEYWKSGFYRIAQQAQVPIVCAFVDRATRSGGFGPVIHLTDDVVADMDRIREFYADKTGLRSGRFNVPRLREEDGSDLVG